MPNGQAQKIGRLSLREEGDYWVAYYTMPDTMEKAVPLGSIHMGTVVDNPVRKQAFMDLMRGIVSDLIFEATGQRPSWSGLQPAPENERTKTV